MAAGGNHVVAAVGGRVVDGFVFSHESDGDLGCQAAERAGFGAEVGVMPGSSVREAGLVRKYE